MEAVKALGLDSKLLIAQIVNFLVVMIALRKFLYRPVFKMLEDRKEKIAQGIKDSEGAREQFAKAQKESQTIIDRAHFEAKDIIILANKRAQKEADQIIKKTNTQAQMIIGNAKDEAESSKKNAVKEAKDEIADMILLSLDKMVSDGMSQNDKEKLTEKAISNL